MDVTERKAERLAVAYSILVLVLLTGFIALGLIVYTSFLSSLWS